MANGNNKAPNNNSAYDPRWFIWTIVILVVTGISLVSYIVFSDPGLNEITVIGSHRTAQTK